MSVNRIFYELSTIHGGGGPGIMAEEGGSNVSRTSSRMDDSSEEENLLLSREQKYSSGQPMMTRSPSEEMIDAMGKEGLLPKNNRQPYTDGNFISSKLLPGLGSPTIITPGLATSTVGAPPAETSMERLEKINNSNRKLLSEKYSNFGIVEGVIKFKTYLVIVYVLLAIFVASLAVGTFVYKAIPGFSITVSTIISIIIFVASGVALYLTKILIRTSSIFGKVVNWALHIGISIAYWFLVIIMSNGMGWLSLIITNITIILLVVGIVLIVWILRTKLEPAADLASNLDVSVVIVVAMVTYLGISTLITAPGLIIYVYMVSFVSLAFNYSDAVVKVFQGITGIYDKFEAIKAFSTLARYVYGLYIMVILVVQVLKTYGFWLGFVTGPPSVFAFL